MPDIENKNLLHTEPSSFYKRYFKDTLLATIGRLLLSLRGLIILPILTKTLGDEAYGIWSQIDVTVYLMCGLTQLQLDFAMTRFLASEQDKSKISKGFFSILGIVSVTSILSSILIFVLANYLAISVFGGASAEHFIRLAATLVFLTAVDQIIIAYFVTTRQMGRYSVFILIQVIGELALVYCLVIADFGLDGAITALVAVRAFLFIIGVFIIRHQIPFARPSLANLKPYLAYSLPLLPAALCYWIVNLSDRYVIGYFLTSASVGQYSAAYVLGNSISLFYAPLSLVLFPAITNLYESNKIPEVKTHLIYSLKLFLIFAIPSVIGLSLLSKPLLNTLATTDFADNYLIVPLVAIATLLFWCAPLGTSVLQLVKRTRLIGLIYTISAIVNILGNIILVPHTGIIGAAISTLITFAIHLSVVWYFSFKEISFYIDMKFIAKSVISSAVMGFVIWVLGPTGPAGIVIAVLMGTSIYFALLILLKGFSKDEYAFFKNMVKRFISTQIQSSNQKQS